MYLRQTLLCSLARSERVLSFKTKGRSPLTAYVWQTFFAIVFAWKKNYVIIARTANRKKVARIFDSYVRLNQWNLIFSNEPIARKVKKSVEPKR